MVRCGSRPGIFAAFAAATLGSGIGCNNLLAIPEAYLVDASVDQGVDSAPAPDSAPSVPFCSTVTPAPSVCSDFDEGAALTLGWSTGGVSPDPSLAGGGTRTLDGIVFDSPPFSLAATTPTLKTTKDAASSILIKYLPTTPPVLTIAAEVYIPSAASISTGGGVLLLGVIFGGEPPGGGAAILLVPTGTELAVWSLGGLGSYTPKVFSKSLPVGAWIQVILTLTPPTASDAGGGSIVTANASTQAGYNAVASIPVPSELTDMQASVIVGLQAAGPMQALRVNYDNVFLRYPL